MMCYVIERKGAILFTSQQQQKTKVVFVLVFKCAEQVKVLESRDLESLMNSKCVFVLGFE